jgi:hypothetical protein
MKSRRRVVGVFGAIGLLIPLAFGSLWSVLEHYPALWLRADIIVMPIQLMLWPSCIFMIGTQGFAAFGAAAMLNVMLYVLVGYLVWLGLARHLVLYLVFLGIAGLWVRMLTILYYW